MRVLLDTCVISELRRKDGNEKVRETVEAIPEDNLFLSVLTIGEIAKGISLLPSGNKKRSLQSWILGLQKFYAKRILPVDIEVSTLWGELVANARREGVTIPAIDGLLAATAKRYGLQLMTRNTSDFVATGAMLINPWEFDWNEWKQYRDEGRK